MICLYCQFVPNHQSCGGVCGDNSQSYTATVINAAKVCSGICHIITMIAVCNSNMSVYIDNQSITLANHKGQRQSSEPVKTQPKYMQLAQSAGNVRVMIDSGFTSDSMRKWHKISKPITKRSNAKPVQMQITFNTRVKSVLLGKTCTYSFVMFWNTGIISVCQCRKVLKK